MANQESYNRNEQYKDHIELRELADKLLRENGCGIWGEARKTEAYRQSKFEKTIKTGAYSRCDSSRRR